MLRIGRFVPDQAQPRNAPAFLVDRDDRLDRTQIAEIVDQLLELSGTDDVAAENNEAAGLHASEKRGGLRVELSAGDADE